MRSPSLDADQSAAIVYDRQRADIVFGDQLHSVGDAVVRAI
jgi:hypothetical protein